MNDLGPKELELLSALRASDEPALADRERIRRRVWLAVGLAALGSSGVGIGTQTAVAATPKVGVLAATTAKVGLIVGLATGGAVLATQHFSNTEAVSAPAMTPTTQVAKSERVMLAEPPLAPAASMGNVVVEPVESQAPTQRTRGKSDVAASGTPADLDAEIVLLRSARQALQSGQFATALDDLNEHARRFPRGVLASERQASIAIALCRSGQAATGKTRAAHYLRRNPNSPLADRVRASCKLD